MGACRYCGKSAGFFRKEHKECRTRYESAKDLVRRICIDASLGRMELDTVKERIRAAWGGVGVNIADDRIEENIADGWTHGLVAAVEDRVLTSEEKRGLNRYRDRFGISEQRLDTEGHFTTFKILALLTSLNEEGTLPRFDRQAARSEFGTLPFNMMKSEQLIWMFRDVGYMQQVTRREFKGSSLGMSFRVAKGVYVRPGTFRGKSVSKTTMEHTDNGTLGITTKHIYFSGLEKKFRVRLEKIVSFEPYSDGLGIMRDTASAKPEVFLMEGNAAWCAINLIEAVLDLEDPTPPKGDAPTLDEIVNEGMDEEEDAAGMFAAGAGSGL